MRPKLKYGFYEHLVIRTPMFAIDHLFESAFENLQENPIFKEALFIASPEYADYIYREKTTNGLRDNSVIKKYYNRMCHRCTPFGLFAGCSIAQWGEHTKLDLKKHSIIRRTRLDKDFLAKLINHLTLLDPIFSGLKLYLNNTLYAVGEEYRYIEKSANSNNLYEYSISAVQQSQYLIDFIKIIGEDGIALKDVLAKAVNMGYAKTQAYLYLKNLYLNNIITTNLDISGPANEVLINCEKVLGEIVAIYNATVVSSWHSYIKEMLLSLASIDESIDGDTSKYENLFSLVAKSTLKQPLNRIIQVDYAHKGTSGQINTRIKSSLSRAIDILSFLNTGATEHYYLENFKRRFVKKYEYQEVPFLVALDPETGIDYLEGTLASDDFLKNEIASALLENAMKFGEVNSNLKLIVQKYEKSISLNNSIIDLTDNDLQQMESVTVEFPPTTSVFFRIFGKNSIQIENIGGSSGINLFTRFTDFSNELKDSALEITDLEQELNKDCIIAEVIHEPQPRNANVIAHPSLRKFVIPYLSQSSKDTESTINLSDLFLSVIDNQLVLKSKKHQKEVLPVLSHAFNYFKGSPIYRFLGDYQYKGSTAGVKFDFMQLLPGKRFYPRVQFKEIVIWPATWLICLKDIKEEFGSHDLNSIFGYLSRKKIETYFIVFENDNELLINKNNPAHLAIFQEILQKKKKIFIKEFLYDATEPIATDEAGQMFNNQIIALLLNNKTKKNTILSKPVKSLSHHVVTRNFSLGSELYCGTYIGDKILAEKIFPLVKLLKKKKLITACFFIRYTDPDPHIRIRFKLSSIKHLADVIAEFRNCILALEITGTIWKVQTDTYSRELERYGNAIEESEAIFSVDSLFILKLISINRIAEDITQRIAAGIRMTADLMSSIELDITQKISFCQQMRKALKYDCKFDTQAEISINNTCKENRAMYGSLLKGGILISLFDKRFLAIKKVINKIIRMNTTSTLDIELPDLLRSYIHMSVNRLFLSNQKVYEYIIYDYLYKLYNELKNKPLSLINEAIVYPATE